MTSTASHRLYLKVARRRQDVLPTLANATIIDCGICVEPKNFGRATLFRGIDEIAHSRYNIGEEVAVAQAYCMLIVDRGYSDKEILEIACLFW